MNPSDQITLLGVTATPYNDLAIPQVMSAVYLITKGVAFGLLVMFFFAEALRLKTQAVAHSLPGSSTPKPNLSGFLWRSFLLFVSIGWLYQWTFLKMVSLCDFIATGLSNEQQWMTLISQLSQNGSVSIPFLNVTVPTLVGALSLTALQYVEEVFLIIRFVMLCLLFSIGPMAWAFSISSIGTAPLRGWFKTTWQTCFWLVMFSVIKAAVIPLVAYAFQANQALTVIPIIYAIVILYSIYMIPTMTAAIFSSANMGAVATAAMSLATFATVKAAGSAGGAAHGTAIGAPAIQTGLGFLQTAQSQGFGSALKGLFTPPAGSNSAAPAAATAESGRTR